MASDESYAEIRGFWIIIKHESHIDVQLSKVSFCYAVIFRIFVNDETVIDTIIIHANKSGCSEYFSLVIEHLRYIFVGLLNSTVILSPPDFTVELLEKQYAELFLWNKYSAFVLALESILLHTFRVSSI